jgi:inner membrane protein
MAKRIWLLGAACAVLPDLDVVGFRLGISYGDFLGHRGFTHSIIFAAGLATMLTLGFRHGLATKIGWRALWAFLFCATASHGLLDALTNGGLGVAFFSPFDLTRYFLPWRPIEVSPISVTRFLSTRGSSVLGSEILWIWIPTAVFFCLSFALRSVRKSQGRSKSSA